MELCPWYLPHMSFVICGFNRHNQDHTRFPYRCFDSILLTGLIQPFQQPERTVGFFITY